MSEKSLDNKNQKDTEAKTSDVNVFGNTDIFKLICKASLKNEGWMKSTKAMDIAGVGCVVQVTTQQRNPDGSYAIAEALTFVPGVKIQTHFRGNDTVGRAIVAATEDAPDFIHLDVE